MPARRRPRDSSPGTRRARASRPTSGASCRRAKPSARSSTDTRRHAGTRSVFPFSSSGSTGLDLDGVADEPVGEVADQDVARGGRLLEAGRDVHRVARDEPLTGGRVAGDDLAGVDADADCEPDAPAPVRARRSARASAARMSAAARTARSASSSWTVGQPEDGHHGVADELLDGAAVRARARRASSSK